MLNSHVSQFTQGRRAGHAPQKPATAGRLTHIDAIRGLLLVFMAVNHIPSDLHALTDHPFGFMSAAEGFVFMAGLMAGYVYTRKWLRGNLDELRRACTSRALSIYRWHVAIYLLVLAGLIAVGFGSGALPVNTPPALLEHPMLSILSGLLLIQQPTLFDILPMYCVLLVATPWLLRLCSRPGGYARLLAGSFALWAAANLFCPQVPFDNGVINTGAFNLAAWQLLYITGLAFGHRWAMRQQTSGNSPHAEPAHLLKSPSTPVLVGLSALAATLFSMRHGFIPSGLPESALHAVTNKNNLAPLRLLDTALIVYLGYLLVSRHSRFFSWRPLAWIGRASLAVFSTHVFAAYAIHAFPEVFSETTAGRWCGTALMAAALACAAAAQTYFNGRRASTSRPAAAPPPLKTRQPRTPRLIVRHESRSLVPADPLHCRSR